MIKASIDIGSNSVLLLVVELHSDEMKELANETRITSLGRELDKTKMFHTQSMLDTYGALQDYHEIIKSFGIEPSEVIVTATEASRVAQNASEFFKKIKNDMGFRVTTISGEGEAYYTAYGVTKEILSVDPTVTIMDIGGASTEFIKVKLSPFSILDSVSLPVGSVRATDWLSDGCYKEKMDLIFSQDLSRFEASKMVCVAGSMTTLASIFLNQKQYDDKEVNGLEVDIEKFNIFVDTLLVQNETELLSKYPVLGKRAKSIAGGALTAKKMMEKLKVKSIVVSTRGLRYGVVMSGGIDAKFIQNF